MGIRLIAVDLDGTLLDSRKQISSENMAAFCKAADAGVLIVPATGRHLGGVPAELQSLGARYVIAVNGAEIYDLLEGHTLRRAEIAPEKAEELFDYMDKLPVIYDCFQNGKNWIPREHYDDLQNYTQPGHTSQIKAIRNPLAEFRRTVRERNMPVQKVEMFFRNMDLRETELSRAKEYFSDLAVTSSAVHNIEFNHLNATKGNALAFLCHYLHIQAEEVIAIGDSENDISMLQFAGVGVAMGNADKIIKDSANFLTCENDKSGVAFALSKLL